MYLVSNFQKEPLKQTVAFSTGRFISTQLIQRYHNACKRVLLTFVSQDALNIFRLQKDGYRREI